MRLIAAWTLRKFEVFLENELIFFGLCNYRRCLCLARVMCDEAGTALLCVGVKGKLWFGFPLFSSTLFAVAWKKRRAGNDSSNWLSCFDAARIVCRRLISLCFIAVKQKELRYNKHTPGYWFRRRFIGKLRLFFYKFFLQERKTLFFCHQVWL